MLRYLEKLPALRNSKGFTMVEALFVLLIFVSMAALFPLIYGVLYRTEEQLDPERRSEWELFVLQLRKEIYLSHSLNIQEDRITFIQGKDQITIEKYKESIRRRVGGRGHEIILQEIDSLTFYPCDSLLCTDAVFTNGEQDKAQFRFFTGE